MEPANREITRNPDGTFLPGVSGNPDGRPKNTMKDYLARKFREMDDDAKEKWLKDNKVTGEVQFKMGEGNPDTKSAMDVTTDGQPIGVVVLPQRNIDADTLETTAEADTSLS